jgi:DNA repair protein RecO (recombination protein O)
MSRSAAYSALVLRARPTGESNREAWFLTAEEGIIRATVFGGPKSRLRAHVAPFHQGTLWVYHDPVKDSRKVTDFDVRSWRPGIREQYERVAAATAVAETILTAHGGGGAWSGALALADGTLDALGEADTENCRRLLIHFLWNWAELLGIRPGLDRCASCACDSPPNEVLWYSLREGSLLCSSCAEGDLPLGPGARRWLKTVETLSPSLIGRYTMDSQSLREALLVVTELLAGVLGKRLSTWDW